MRKIAVLLVMLLLVLFIVVQAGIWKTVIFYDSDDSGIDWTILNDDHDTSAVVNIMEYRSCRLCWTITKIDTFQVTLNTQYSNDKSNWIAGQLTATLGATNSTDETIHACSTWAIGAKYMRVIAIHAAANSVAAVNGTFQINAFFQEDVPYGEAVSP